MAFPSIQTYTFSVCGKSGSYKTIRMTKILLLMRILQEDLEVLHTRNCRMAENRSVATITHQCQEKKRVKQTENFVTFDELSTSNKYLVQQPDPCEKNW